MKVRRNFRQWADQWPDESRWIIWVWGICLVALVVIGWGGYRRWRGEQTTKPVTAPVVATPVGPPAAAPAKKAEAWEVNARRADLDFPADPALWVVAARLLESSDTASARRLLRDAAAVGTSDPPIPGMLLAAGRPAGPDETEFARSCSATVDDALLYSGWLMVQGRLRDASVWLDALPQTVARQPVVRARQATILGAQQRFDVLKTKLVAGAWGPINPASLDLAFAAQRAAQKDLSSLQKDLWKVALDAGGTSAASQAVLLRLALQLGERERSAGSFARLLTASPGDLRVIRQYAVWAHQQNNPGQWARAFELWQEFSPAEASAYLAESAASPRRSR